MEKQTKRPLVSVMVPVYAAEQYIGTCVDSLLAQTYDRCEIILVDDGSGDRGPQICDEYARNHPNVRVIHKENGGLSSARAAGIQAAAGDWLMVVDSDDWLDPETVERCVDRALRDGADCVMFSYVKEYGGIRIPTHLFDGDFSYDAALSEDLVHRRVVGLRGGELSCPEKVDNFSSVCMKLYRMEAARRGRIVSERRVGTGEDTVFNLYALDGCRISYIDQCFYHYRKTNAQAITTRYKAALGEKWDELYRLFQEYIDGSGRAEAYRPVFLNRVACGMIGFGLNEIVSSDGIWKKSRRLKRELEKPLYREAFAKLDISPCPLKWKVFFVLCKGEAALLLAVLLEIMNFLRSRMAA